MNSRTSVLMTVVAVAFLAAACGSGRTASTPPVASVPAGTTSPATSTSSRPTTPAKASPAHPLAERTFRVVSATTAVQDAAIRALEGYFDMLITAFATNRVPDQMRRYTTPRIFADAQRLVAPQVKGGYVVYGAFVFTLKVRGATANVAVINACVNQRNTRRHDATTGRAGRVNDTPHVRLDYTLNHHDVGGWVVTGYKGDNVPSCPH